MTRREKMLHELERDIREHLEREMQDNIDRGMSPDEARFAAILMYLRRSPRPRSRIALRLYATSMQRSSAMLHS